MLICSVFCDRTCFDPSFFLTVSLRKTQARKKTFLTQGKKISYWKELLPLVENYQWKSAKWHKVKSNDFPIFIGKTLFLVTNIGRRSFVVMLLLICFFFYYKFRIFRRGGVAAYWQKRCCFTNKIMLLPCFASCEALFLSNLVKGGSMLIAYVNFCFMLFGESSFYNRCSSILSCLIVKGPQEASSKQSSNFDYELFNSSNDSVHF